MIRKFLCGIALLGILGMEVGMACAAPGFDSIAMPLQNGSESVIAPNSLGVDANMPLSANIYFLFSPNNNNSSLRQALRVVMTGVLVLFLTRTGIDMMQKATDEKGLQKARRSFLYILVGAFFVRGVTWLLGTALQIGNVHGSQGLVRNLQNNVLFQILAFLKGLAFFYAIIMFIYYGFQFMRALEEEAKIKAARVGIINVIVALILIKIIDFIYYIAQQQNFGSQLQQFLVNTARISAYVLGAGMVLMLIRGGVKYLTAQGDEAKVKDAQKIITTTFFIILTLFLFLLIAYQLIAQFT